MSRYIKYQGKLVKFADKILKMAEWIYNEGAYYLRVIAGGGTVANRGLVEDLYKLWEEQGRLDNIKVAILPQAGGVQRTSGIYRFFSKLFTLRTDANDVTQTTANSQPYVVNGAMVNPNGASRSMVHPTITYTGSDSWTATFILNWNGTINAIAGLVGKGFDTASLLSLRLASNNRFSIINEAAATVSGAIGNTNKVIGKYTYVNFIANGTTLKIYIGTVLIETLTVNTAIVLSSIIKAYNTASRDFNGSIKYYTLETGNPTDPQIVAEHAVLRSYIPEIATTLIGTDEIATENCQMVATPMGRVINLNNTAGNVELITNAADREFSSDTGFWAKGGGATINDGGNGVATLTGGGSYIIASNILTANKLYRFRFTLNGNLGRLVLMYGAGITMIGGDLNPSQNKTYELYLTPGGGGNFLFYSSGFIGSIDNVSIEEVGFAGASDLYTAIYNQTTGTVAQKTSAALAAAAMWRSPDSDLDKQAVFGKIFNDYAAALMRFDIAAYNTANPSTPWGYHVMTRAEEQALALLDADTLKSNSLWTSTNGTNETGLSLLGSGVINAYGTYSNFGTKTRLMTGEGYALDVNDDGTSAEIAVTTEGGILRLVKD